MEPWLNVNIDYRNVKKEDVFGQDLNGEKLVPESWDVRYLSLIGYKEKKSRYSNFYPIENFPQLLGIELDLTNVSDFQDVSKCRNLKHLNLDYCRNLASWDGITNLAKHLEVLCISNAKKLRVSEELFT